MNSTDKPTCPRENCFAPDTGCILGRDNCEFFARAEGEVASAALDQPTSALPWSGLALGSADLTAVAAVGESRVVGLVGLSDAGKTTTLAAAQLARRSPEYGGIGDFAGSYTLMGWHQIIRHLEWAPWGGGFPPHTELRGSRTPALLHVAISLGNQRLRHVLYTDVPGEWYARWAFDATAAPGVTWIVDHADSFIIFADSQALNGPDRGVARARYDTLARRLAGVAAGRTVVPVLSKADIEISSEMNGFIIGLNERAFGSDTLLVSAVQENGRSLVTAIDRATAAALSWAPELEMPTSEPAGDVLFAFRDPVST